jgi:predicted transcriptional regulator
MKNPDSRSAKQRVIETVDQQPDDSSFDEILHELAFARMIEWGVADADAGRVISHDQLIRETESWSK